MVSALVRAAFLVGGESSRARMRIPLETLVTLHPKSLRPSVPRSNLKLIHRFEPFGSPSVEKLRKCDSAPFEKSKGVAQCRIASRCDLEATRTSLAGMMGATADGQPITSARSCSTRNATPNPYAMYCASCARAMPTSSTSNQPILGLGLASRA